MPSVATVLVPIVLAIGGKNGSYYTSEMTLANKGVSTATIAFTYVAAFGGGGGGATDTLGPGQQRIVRDAIAYLRSLGVPIPAEGGRGGTLRVRFSGLGSPGDASVTVRTTTAVPDGRAGLAYPAITTGLEAASYLCGLRQNASDRSNVAILNAGDAAAGNVVLRLTVFSGSSGSQTILPDETLGPGAFKQFNEILGPLGLADGYVKLERVAGTAPYDAYAVVNDQATSDGSFVPAVLAGAGAAKRSLTLPVIVEAGAFTSELVLTNFSGVEKTLDLSYVADNIQTPSKTALFSITLAAGRQRIIPGLVQYLRDSGVAGIAPPGTTYAGALFATTTSGDLQGVSVAARTSAAGGGGRFGLFYAATLQGDAIEGDAWVYGLQQDAENRTNLALINTGELGGADTFTIEIFDGPTGRSAGKLENVQLEPRRWTQIGTVLLQAAPGTSQAYARISRTSGLNPYLAYAVVNDGSGPGQRSGDGAFLAAEKGVSSVCVAATAPELVACAAAVQAGTRSVIEIHGAIVCSGVDACRVRIEGGPSVWIRGAAGASIRRLDHHEYPLLRAVGSAQAAITDLVIDENAAVPCVPVSPTNPPVENAACALTIDIYGVDDVELDRVTVAEAKSVAAFINTSGSARVSRSRFIAPHLFGIEITGLTGGLTIEDTLFWHAASNAVVLYDVHGTAQAPLFLRRSLFEHNHRDDLYYVCGPQANEKCSGGQLLVAGKVDFLRVEKTAIRNGAYDGGPTPPVGGVELNFPAVRDITFQEDDIHTHGMWGVYLNTDPVDVARVSFVNDKLYGNGTAQYYDGVDIGNFPPGIVTEAGT
ncbi:MAG TPA: hypothetical protein VKF32_06715, partial [Thermoanaerobaculia bacterium]|nr:hypothetical protein [Thermoanaerobaculia bacterium]